MNSNGFHEGNVNRIRKGVPGGGRFSHKQRGEGDVGGLTDLADSMDSSDENQWGLYQAGDTPIQENPWGGQMTRSGPSPAESRTENAWYNQKVVVEAPPRDEWSRNAEFAGGPYKLFVMEGYSKEDTALIYDYIESRSPMFAGVAHYSVPADAYRSYVKYQSNQGETALSYEGWKAENQQRHLSRLAEVASRARRFEERFPNAAEREAIQTRACDVMGFSQDDSRRPRKKDAANERPTVQRRKRQPGTARRSFWR